MNLYKIFEIRKLFSIFRVYVRHRKKAEKSYDATASRTISAGEKKGTRD